MRIIHTFSMYPEMQTASPYLAIPRSVKQAFFIMYAGQERYVVEGWPKRFVTTAVEVVLVVKKIASSIQGLIYHDGDNLT